MGSEKVTVEEAFERVGGFGRFQIFSGVMNMLTNMGAAFFLFAFAFLEKEPVFKCQLTPGSQVWTFGNEENTLEDQYCSNDYICEIDWENPQSLHNLIEQLDMYCAPKMELGIVGFMFLLGIVIGCLTVTRLGDYYGRRPIYMLGLFLHLIITIGLVYSKEPLFDFALLFGLGISLTARYYVGYTFNIEMQPRSHQVLVSTCQFVSEAVVYIFICIYFSQISKDWRLL